jgi:hypothetical protein
LLKNPLARALPHDQWCRLAFNVPIGASKTIGIAGMNCSGYSVFFDEIWVIAKQFLP